MIEVVHASVGTLVCCGKEMILQEPNTVEAAKEKHIPVLEQTEGEIKIKVGSVLHPMEEKHYIEWIEIETEDGRIGRKYLKPGDAPEVIFYTKKKVVKAKAYCNIHGLWSN
jgi:superoxide reductase